MISDDESEDKAAAAAADDDDEQLAGEEQQHQQQVAEGKPTPNSDAMHVDLADDDQQQHELMILSDDDAQQQQQQVGQDDGTSTGQQRKGSPEAAAAAAATSGWQPPIPLDGSVEVTEQQLLDLLPQFHSVHAEECPECAASLQVAAAGHQEVKQQLEVQRAAFGKLLSGTVQEVLEPGVTYYLVPRCG